MANMPEPQASGRCRGVGDAGVEIYYELHHASGGRRTEERDVRLLMIMGLACPLEGWRTQLQFFTSHSAAPEGVDLVEGLRDRMVCCVMDNRGVGRSTTPKKAADYSIEIMADDIAQLMEHLGWESAHVMGHSMGSMIGTRLACQHPKRVDSLTLISTTGGGWDILPSWRGMWLFMWFAMMQKSAQMRAEFDLLCHFTETWLGDLVPHDNPDSRALPSPSKETPKAGSEAGNGEAGQQGTGRKAPLRRVVSRQESLRHEYIQSTLQGKTAQEPEGLNGQLAAAFWHKVTDEDVRVLRGQGFPISLIHGLQDHVVSLKAAQNLARRLGQRAKMLQTWGAHFVHRESTEEVNTAIQLQVLEGIQWREAKAKSEEFTLVERGEEGVAPGDLLISL